MIRLAPFIVLAAIAAADPAVARDCAAIDTDARRAEVGKDIERLVALHAEATAPGAGCDGAWLAVFSDDVARAHVDRFFMRTGVAGGGPKAMAANLPILLQGRRFGEPWQLLLTLAEVNYELADYDEAAPLYETAVAKMTVMARTLLPKSPAAQQLPSVDDFKVIHGRMVQAALLAADLPDAASLRDAAETGLFVERWRGYAVKAVPVPVQFTFGTADFTEKGRKAADYLAAYLAKTKPAAIALVGHTDPVGTVEANRTLSLARAAALRDHVVAAGYGGKVRIEGRGESEPFRAIDAARFAGDEAALHALDRRVELVR